MCTLCRSSNFSSNFFSYIFFRARFHTAANDGRLINRETIRTSNERKACITTTTTTIRGKVRHIRLTFESHELLRLCSIATVIFDPLKRSSSPPSTFPRYISRGVQAHQHHREIQFSSLFNSVFYIYIYISIHAFQFLFTVFYSHQIPSTTSTSSLSEK